MAVQLLDRDDWRVGCLVVYIYHNKVKKERYLIRQYSIGQDRSELQKQISLLLILIAMAA